MKPAPVPANDAQRLATLAEYGVLDTPPEAVFDELTALAAELLDVPISLISLVDVDRQWFKSRYGLDVPETPRDVSLCGHVVALDAPLLVEDAHEDERFRDNPLVTGAPFVRFYAGVPLRAKDGHLLGTLCAIDHAPKKIPARDARILEVLAREVVSQLELRRQRMVLADRGRALETQLAFFDLSADLFCTIDRARSSFLSELNPAWERTLGWTREELHERPISELVHPEDRALTLEVAERLFEEPLATRRFENRYAHKCGRWVHLSWVARSSQHTIYATARDVTESRLHEAERLENAARLRALFDGMVEGAVLQARTGEILQVNAAAEQILGLTADQMAGRTSVDPRWKSTREDGSPFPGESHPAMIALRTGERQRDVVMGVQTPSGEERWIVINAEPLVRPGAGEPHAVVTTFRDVTDARRASLGLHHERQFLSTVLARVPGAAIFVVDGELRIERAFGPPGVLSDGAVEAWKGLLIAGLAEGAGDDVLQAAQRCLSGEAVRLELTRGHRKYDVAFVPWRGERAARALVLAYEVTERDAMREQLARQERLVTVGTLAAGVGHEINNPLSYLMTNLDVVHEELRAYAGASPSSRMADTLAAVDEAKEGAERIRKIVRGLRAFARVDGGTAALDVHAIVELSANMAMHEIRQRASLSIERGPLELVLADEARLAQVFVNLLVNAAQSFPKASPAENRIEVRARPEPPGWVVVEVRDNGPGISPEVLPRIFDPFFTTKPIGVGTGLGLSICHNVVTGLGGTITCETELGRGTIFRVTLPVDTAPAHEVSSAKTSTPLGPRGRVVMIDDEQVLLRSVTRLLAREHDVRTFSDARDALGVLLDPAEDPDVVFCDIMMPHLNGMELHRQVALRRPNLAERFVFITGGVTVHEIRQFLDAVPNERLEKPFSNQNLRGMVRRFVARG